jgi:hypothetical protein
MPRPIKNPEDGLAEEQVGKRFQYPGVELELHGLSPPSATLDGRRLEVSQSRFPVGVFNQLVLED